jgi:hypothetical protein
VIGGWSVGDCGLKVEQKIMMSDESVQRGLFQRVGVVLVMDEERFLSTIEDQDFNLP